MQPKVELPQIRSNGEIIDDSILFFKQNWKPLLKSYFVICGLFWLAGLIVAILNQTKSFEHQAQGQSVFSAVYFLNILFGFINFVLIAITVLSFVALYQEKDNNAPSVEEVWGYVNYYFLRVLGSTFLLALLLCAGTVACVLPGIYLIPVIMLITAVMVLENASFGFAFKRGLQLIKSNWWNVFTILIVIGIIVIAVMALMAIPISIITFLVLFATKVSHGLGESIGIAVVFNSLQVLYMLPVIAVAITYFNLNEQKDDLHIIQRIEMLGRNSYDDNQLPSEEY